MGNHRFRLDGQPKALPQRPAARVDVQPPVSTVETVEVNPPAGDALEPAIVSSLVEKREAQAADAITFAMAPSLYGEAPARLLAKGQRLEMGGTYPLELTEAPPGALNADLRLPDGQTVRMPLKLVDLVLTGAATTAEGAFELKIQPDGNLTLTREGRYAGGPWVEGSYGDVRKATAPLREHELGRRIDTLLEGTPPGPSARRAALTLLRALPEGRRGTDLKVLEPFERKPAPSDDDLINVPFNCVLTADPFAFTSPESTAERCTQLEASLEVVARQKGPGGLLAGELLAAHRREGQQGQPALFSLLAAVYAARRAAKGKLPESPERHRAEAVLIGWQWADQDRRLSAGADPATVLSLSRACVKSLRAGLPQTSALRAHFDQLARENEATPDPFTQLTRNSLALGAVERWVATGVMPAEVDTRLDGMPVLSTKQAMTPTRLAEVSLGEFDAAKLSWSDLAQNGFGTCWFLHPLAALATVRPSLLEDFISVDRDPGSGREAYRVRLQLPDSSGVAKPTDVPVDGRLFITQTGEPVGAGPRQEPSKLEHNPKAWGAIAEKAVAQIRPHGYDSASGGQGHEGFDLLVPGAKGRHIDLGYAPFALENLQRLLAWSLPVTATSLNLVTSSGEPRIAPNHVYMVAGLETVGGESLVKLINLHPTANDQYAAGEVTLPLERFCTHFRHVSYCQLEPEVTPESLRRAGLKSENQIPK